MWAIQTRNILGGFKWAHRVEARIGRCCWHLRFIFCSQLGSGSGAAGPGTAQSTGSRTGRTTPPPDAKLVHSNDHCFPSRQRFMFQQLKKFVNSYLRTTVLHGHKTTTEGGGGMSCHRLQSSSEARRSVRRESSSSRWRAISSWSPLATSIRAHVGNRCEKIGFALILKPVKTPPVKLKEVLAKVK